MTTPDPLTRLADATERIAQDFHEWVHAQRAVPTHSVDADGSVAEHTQTVKFNPEAISAPALKAMPYRSHVLDGEGMVWKRGAGDIWLRLGSPSTADSDTLEVFYGPMRYEEES